MGVGVVSGVDLHVFLELGIALSMLGVGFFIGLKKKVKSCFIPKNKKIDASYWDRHGKIHETLSELRIKTDSARTQVVQFHNGEYFMDGVSMKLKSLTHESLANGVAGEGEKKQRLQLSVFMPIMQKVMRNSSQIHELQGEEESFCKQFLEASNVVSFCVLPLRAKGTVTGYLTIQWCSLSKAIYTNENKVRDEIEKARDRIEVYLSQDRDK